MSNETKAAPTGEATYERRVKQRRVDTKMVPVPSTSIVPERDVNSKPVLETRHLGIDFGGLHAVEEFNLTVGKTEIAGLIGPNGAGKTTVFNLLTKVYQPTHGTILLDGQDTAGMTVPKVNQAGIARTFQNIRLFSRLSVEDNVRIGLHNQIKCSMLDRATTRARRSSTSARWSCSMSSAWPTRRGRSQARCHTAPSAAWRSCARSRPIPSSFCSTSPRRA